MISRPTRLSPATSGSTYWQQPHNVRSAFRHMREFIPTHLISAGTSSPRPLYVSLKSIVLEGMATDFVSRWDKSRMSFTFDDWLFRRRGHGASSPPFGL
jgi:hypothetical protein